VLPQNDLLFRKAVAIGKTEKNGFRQVVSWTSNEFVLRSKGIVGEEKVNVPDGRQINLQGTHHTGGERSQSQQPRSFLVFAHFCLAFLYCVILSQLRNSQGTKREGTRKGGKAERKNGRKRETKR
jgi:hypothetical protein